ncbi:MAG: hypothetical protein J2P22_14240 [Nocardioides sp.]|nr:hypothetical protein [Nocardioides sp.]
MTTPWIVAFIGLAAVVAALALYVLGLGQRVLKTLDEVVAVHPAESRPGTAGTGGPPIGQPAPQLPQVERVNDRDEKAQKLILFAEADCAPCTVLAADLSKRSLDPREVELIAVVDDPGFRGRFRDEWTVVVDTTRELSSNWRISGTPHATLVNDDGDVIYNGVVNTRREVKNLLRTKFSQV